MEKIKLIVSGMLLFFVLITSSGCALVGAAISAGIAYGIAEAVKD